MLERGVTASIIAEPVPLCASEMNRRRSIQQQHEQALVRDFLSWLNTRRRWPFTVIAEPNPPEAIIKSARATTWVEVADAYWNREWARHVLSKVTPGETHKPIRPGPHKNMDRQFARSFVDVLSRKLAKRSYVPFRDCYGPGYLVVCEQHPFFDASTIDEMRETWKRDRPTADLGCFRAIYIAHRAGNGRGFLRWRV